MEVDRLPFAKGASGYRVELPAPENRIGDAFEEDEALFIKALVLVQSGVCGSRRRRARG